MEFVIDNLSKSFEAKKVLRNVNFTFESGKIYGLLGRNGAGKTTLFNCLNRDIDADNGDFYFMENDQKIKVEPEDIGYVLSTPTVPEFLTGREFVKFFIDINKDRIDDIKTVEEYLDIVSFDSKDADLLMKDYSHGMKNKMQMLVNIISTPKLLLLDEPLTSLDVVVSEEIKEILKNQKAGHVTILSTHILDLAIDLCDTIVLLNNGTLQLVNRNELEEDEFRDKIIEALKSERNA
jgi:ABC-2 type transport system ATP-binding protein